MSSGDIHVWVVLENTFSRGGDTSQRGVVFVAKKREEKSISGLGRRGLQCVAAGRTEKDKGCAGWRDPRRRARSAWLSLFSAGQPSLPPAVLPHRAAPRKPVLTGTVPAHVGSRPPGTLVIYVLIPSLQKNA